MDLGTENGIKPITADEWMEWAITPKNKQEVNNVST
jgi:hypothetical protein